MNPILLNPGPVTLSNAVRESMLGADLCHREPEFAELQGAIRQKLLDCYSLDQSAWSVALMTGSGTAAVEAMISSMVPGSGKLLVLENGVYGERMHKIASRYGIAVSAAAHAWTSAIDIANVKHLLEADPDITHVATVHHETTTGRLNDLSALGEVCTQHNVQILLDAVSSFGAEAIDFNDLPIAACAATANKCLHGVPGTCFVVAGRDSLNQAHPRSVYLDVCAYVKAQDASGTPFTQSIQTFYALNAALDELVASGGVMARGELYRQRLATVRSKLAALGIKPLLASDDCSCVLHGFELPTQISYAELHAQMKAAGFIIYAGQGDFATSIFRISMMGEISGADLARLLDALDAALG